MKPTLRGALPTDAKPIARILAETGWFGEFDELDPKRQEERVRTLLKETLASEHRECQVAVDSGGRVLGYAHCHLVTYLFLPNAEWYLSELFVEADARGQGVGSALLDWVKERGRERGAWRVALVNGRERESYQRAFYRSRGFIEKDRASLVCKL